jgi:hypothetical protein
MRRFLFIAALLAPSTALAHIHLTFPQARTDSETGDQKDQHCGVANQQRNPARVSEFRPGDTITVTWLETINHPGWFRIAFQPDGAVFGIPPVGTTGCRYPNVVACPNNAAPNFPDTAGQLGLDPNNGSIVLADMIPDGMLSAQITFPDMECSNCTLQFIQVMTDKYPYTVDALSDDIYFNCADITLSANAMPPPDAGVPETDGGVDPGGGGGNVSGGGCTSAPGSGLVIGLALLGVLRRRRSR